jgi:hypothetical protein
MRLATHLSFFLLVSVVFTAISPTVSAQGPIRVESNQVLVPAVVFDSKIYEVMVRRDHKRSLGYLIEHDRYFVESVVPRNLLTENFHLFEDGQEQPLQYVKFEAPALSVVRDNMGKHPQMIGRGGGRWAYPDVSEADPSAWLPWPQYVIAYVPPASPEGSCHHIQVNLNRKNLIVWARSEFCNTVHSATDPLSGTEFGKQMEADLDPAKPATIDLKLQTINFLQQTGAARTYIKLEFSSRSLKHELRSGRLYATIGTLGMVYGQDGSLVARFSDFACCDYGNDKPDSASHGQDSEDHNHQPNSMIPDRYETQLDLPPGEYNLVVVLSDGEKFGRQQTSLTVKDFEDNQLAISEVALCRRIHALPVALPDAPAEVSASYSPLISKGIEFTPTENTSFRKDDTLYAYLDIYDAQNSGQNPTGLAAALRIVDARTGKVKVDFKPVDAASYMTAGSSLISIGRGVSLKRLSRGSYRFEVQASDGTGKTTPWRSTDFSIE